jgi:hypothetical protein
VAKYCLLAPLSDTNLAAAAAGLAGRTVETNENLAANGQLIRGLAEFRQAHYAEAADWAAKAVLNSRQTAATEAQAASVLALAQEQSGRTNEAAATLTAAAQIVESKLARAESGDLGPDWGEWIVARALLQEARDLRR